jgi:hypothetical protein
MSDKQYMVFETKKNGTINMSKETFARWLCLAEAFYIIDKKAEDLNINLNDNDWVKPLAFEKYIDQRFEGMMLDVAHDEKKNMLGNNFIHHTHRPEYIDEESIISTVS